MKKRNFLVPVYKSNNKLASDFYIYHRNPRQSSDRALVPNFEKDLHLFLTEILPTRGSFRAVLQDVQGHNYYMMGSDFNNLLERTAPKPNFNGTFTVAHKSYDYTIRLIDPAHDEPLNDAKMIDMMNNPGGFNNV